MHPKTLYLLALSASAALLCTLAVLAQDNPGANPPTPGASPVGPDAKVPDGFDAVADKALAAMQKRAEALNCKGVAVVSFSEGDAVQSWSSKMVAVGRLTSPPSTTSTNGENNLAIAYTKAAEMAVLLKDSGSHRPLLKGENGWSGGVMSKAKTGLVFAAFSGASSSNDVKISQAGLEVLAAGM